jgi:Flp pilus assembly protein TadD
MTQPRQAPAHQSGSAAAQALAAARLGTRDAYARGAFDQAITAQRRVLAEAKAQAAAAPDDFLFLGLMLYGAQQMAEGIETLRDGCALFPDNAPMHENLGVFLLQAGDIAGAIDQSTRAIALGSDSPNVHDCLCDAWAQLGRRDEAIAAGCAALEAKDRKFGRREPLVAIPDGTPPPFNWGHAQENVIAYCLWGNEPRYLVPLSENVRIAPHLFPGWTIRLYHDATVPQPYLQDLAGRGVQLRTMVLPPNVSVHRKLLWRFEVIADPTVRRFLLRDADSLLSVKERVAVDAWLQSGFWFHAMRDWYTHTDLLLAGMWGGVGNVLPSTTRLMQAYTAWRVENNHIDQDVLSETVWPTIRRHCLIHDSVFTGCLGSVAFPPFGHAAPGMHIGQNAFLHFQPG